MIISQTINICFPLNFLFMLLVNGCVITDSIKEEHVSSKMIGSGNQNEIIQENFTSNRSEPIQESTITDNSEIIQEMFNEREAVTEKRNDEQNVTGMKVWQLPVYGYVENVLIGSGNLKLKAKLDSGAKTSSLNALDVVEFERDGNQWVRFHMIDPAHGENVEFERKIEYHVRIKQHGRESQRRAVVMMEVQLGTIHIERAFTLARRQNFLYQVLLGRNFLNGVVLIDVSQTFVAGAI